MSKLAIVDLDGVVANSEARFARATTNGRIEWKVAFDPALVELDTLIDGVADILTGLESNGYKVVFLTSRPAPMEDATQQWLLLHNLLSQERVLIMKPLSAQYTKTKVWKAEMVQQIAAQMRCFWQRKNGPLGSLPVPIWQSKGRPPSKEHCAVSSGFSPVFIG